MRGGGCVCCCGRGGRWGGGGGSGPQRLTRALGIETGNPIMTYLQRSSFLPSFERAPHRESPRGGDPSP